jgi:hypothetical protein
MQALKRFFFRRCDLSNERIGPSFFGGLILFIAVHLPLVSAVHIIREEIGAE